jgi:SAM-dependent methyltransferase
LFGETLDYLLLRALAHRRNIATEAELDARAHDASAVSFEAAMQKMTKLVRRFAGRLPLDQNLRYLDMGCGTGELTLALARLGARRITGVDFLPRSIATARAQAARLRLRDAQFICEDLHDWTPQEKFDVLLSFDAFEHIREPAAFLRRMRDFIAPGGIALVAFGPLFHSPFGDHMWGFFRVQLPWRGVLFSERGLMRLRREFFRPTDPARGYGDIAGGLNQMRYSQFLEYVRRSGWRFDYLAVNTFLMDQPPLRAVSDTLARLPRVQDFIAHNVYAALRPA